MLTMQAEKAVITRVYERFGCLYVEGRVLRRGDWLEAKFTVHKPDIIRMSRAEFEEFALRQLPHVTSEKRWNEKGEELALAY